MSAVNLRGDIVLFGGDRGKYFSCFVFDETGELLEDLSKEELIPGSVNGGTAIVERGKLYTVGQTSIKKALKWRVVVFEGGKWQTL